MQNKKFYFAISHPPKCIANLRTQPIHFKMNLEIYQTSFVLKEVVLVKSKYDIFKVLETIDFAGNNTSANLIVSREFNFSSKITAQPICI